MIFLQKKINTTFTSLIKKVIDIGKIGVILYIVKWYVPSKKEGNMQTLKDNQMHFYESPCLTVIAVGEDVVTLSNDPFVKDEYPNFD